MTEPLKKGAEEPRGLIQDLVQRFTSERDYGASLVITTVWGGEYFVRSLDAPAPDGWVAIDPYPRATADLVQDPRGGVWKLTPERVFVRYSDIRSLRLKVTEGERLFGFQPNTASQ